MKISNICLLLIGMSFSVWASGCGESCPDSLDACGIGCFDLENDEKHCGKCEIACDKGEVCIEGACVCRDDHDLCGDECVSTYSNNRHCGECFNECSADEACEAGECVRCDDYGLVRCDQRCIDINFSRGACGSCGHECGEDEICIYGVCETGECEEYGFSTGCLFTTCSCYHMNDPVNCGDRLHVCNPEDSVCIDGSCQAGTCEDYSLTACPTLVSDELYMCVDTMTDILSCGGCYNACESGQSCIEGVCQ